MKKHLFLFIVALFVTHLLQSQITLNQSNTNFSVGTILAKGADTTGFTLPSIGTDQDWNYSGLTAINSDTWDYIPSTNLNFPSNCFLQKDISSVIVPGKYFLSDSYFQNDVNGMNYLGFVINEQHYGIGNLTGNMNDTIIFPNQHYNLDNPSYSLAYPATFNTVWNTNTRSVVNFNLTISAYSLNQVPCQKVTNLVKKDTIISWGKLSVPTLQGPSIDYDVLMVQRSTIYKDSFYLAGTPAPFALLNAFGLSQGQTTISNRYLFYRENARYTLMLINFESNDFNHPVSVYYDGTAQTDPNYINQYNNSNLTIYPNPNNGNFFISTNISDSEPYEIIIMNQIGQIIHKQTISYGQSVNNICLNDVSSGLYYINILSKNKIYNSKFIVK